MDAPAFAYSANASIKNLYGGRKIVVTGGVAVRITSVETPIGGILAQALRTNTGMVTIGGSDVDSTAGFESGIELIPGQSLFIPLDDLSKLWIDADISNEGIQYLLYNG